MREKSFEMLKKLGIDFEHFTHPPLFTCEDAKKHRLDCEFLDVKNLFLRGKDRDNIYLAVLPSEKRADLKMMQELLGEARLRFADSELLQEKLKVTAGAVSLLCVANLDSPDVKVLIDKDVLAGDKVGFHPSVNTETLVFACSSIPKILDYAKVKWCVI